MVVVIVMIMLLYVDMMIYIISRYVPCFVKHCHGNLSSGIVLLHQVSKLLHVTDFKAPSFSEKAECISSFD